MCIEYLSFDICVVEYLAETTRMGGEYFCKRAENVQPAEAASMRPCRPPPEWPRTTHRSRQWPTAAQTCNTHQNQISKTENWKCKVLNRETFQLKILCWDGERGCEVNPSEHSSCSAIDPTWRWAQVAIQTFYHTSLDLIVFVKNSYKMG